MINETIFVWKGSVISFICLTMAQRQLFVRKIIVNIYHMFFKMPAARRGVTVMKPKRWKLHVSAADKNGRRGGRFFAVIRSLSESLRAR
jgi:hypothetical protein